MSYAVFHLSLPVAPDLTFRAGGRDATPVVRRNAGTSLSLFCDANAVPAATFVEIRRRTAAGDELVLNRTELNNSDTQTVRYTLDNLMLSDPFDVFFCAANNSVELREQSFTLVVQGEWALIGTHCV